MANQSCKDGKSVGRDDWLWHPKLCAAKAKLCAAKHGIGGPGTLWHIKSPDLPKAVSQSLRIPLWHIKSPDLSKAVSQSPRIQLTLNSVIRMPISLAEKHSKAKTGKLSPEFGFAEFWSFGTRRLHKRWLFRCQNVSPLYFAYFIKSRFFLLFLKAAKAKLCVTNTGAVMTTYGYTELLKQEKKLHRALIPWYTKLLPEKPCKIKLPQAP